MTTPAVGIIMGSQSDWPTMKEAAIVLDDLGVAYDFKDLFGGSLEGLTARISLTNVTDQDPEIIPARVQANTDPSAYDTLGRRYFVTFTYAFQ